MLIQHMRELRPEGLGADGGKEEDVSDLMELYRCRGKQGRYNSWARAVQWTGY
jgi:hypothetical protein